jgi:hypothetical protein
MQLCYIKDCSSFLIDTEDTEPYTDLPFCNARPAFYITSCFMHPWFDIHLVGVLFFSSLWAGRT